ncbi:hypothetical protein FSP39_014290 [Pinctada imbricata]|uniref:Uncharacterized protein n=1 Tax=Pinctada imbricata TaxID=66713 RepID=A0AA89C918_PINIB|nr:hypothetical protein FSP39_014290 [Pinctada imbricata]
MDEDKFRKVRGGVFFCLLLALAGILTPSITAYEKGTQGMIIGCYSDGCSVNVEETEMRWNLALCVIGAFLILIAVMYGSFRPSLNLIQRAQHTASFGSCGSMVYVGSLIWYVFGYVFSHDGSPGYSFYLGVVGGALGLLISVALRSMADKQARMVGASGNVGATKVPTGYNTSDSQKARMQGTSHVFSSQGHSQGQGHSPMFASQGHTQSQGHSPMFASQGHTQGQGHSPMFAPQGHIHSHVNSPLFASPRYTSGQGHGTNSLFHA